MNPGGPTQRVSRVYDGDPDWLDTYRRAIYATLVSDPERARRLEHLRQVFAEADCVENARWAAVQVGVLLDAAHREVVGR
ncbi:hypothetical protein [Streptomyces buecherae]|uniref:hypothetical protein n=1 Tax=Streptomyces buecherae TaxID=2763006 RepID=UPI0037ACAEE0